MREWQSLIVTPDTSIREAMRIIDRGGHGIAFVIADDARLIGALSDGNILRGLLGTLGMHDPVSAIMNTSPHSIPVGLDREGILDRMRLHNVSALPVVDSEGKVCGVEVLRKLFERPEIENPVFIMAGGFGTRLRPLTDQTPKPMLKVGDKPMLAHIIDQFERAGFSRIFISTHYLPEKITDYFGDGSRFGVDITYVHEETPLGTGGALGLLPDDLPDMPLIMINGDVLTKVDFARLLHHHVQSGVEATMCVREYEYQVPFGVVESADNLVVGMVEKPLYRYHVNTGIYVFDPTVVRSVKRNTVVDAPTILEGLITDGRKVGFYSVFDYWLDIGRIDDYERAQSDIHDVGVS